MKSRYVVRLFFSTLLVGGLATGLVGFIVRWNEFQSYFTDFDAIKVLTTFLWLIGVGFIFSVISQMGFFAYLTIHRFGLGLFRSAKTWNGVQIILIAFVLFDLVYFRETLFGEGAGISSYLVDAALLFIAGLIIAYVKARQTNQGAFIPALFLMVVVTAIEWVPALRVNDEKWLYVMLISLIVCNAYQLLLLHKLNAKSAEERKISQKNKPLKGNAN